MTAIGGRRTNRLVQDATIVVVLLIVLLAGREAIQPAEPAQPADPGEVGAVVAPVPGGRFTSGFGTRWGTQHYGSDVAAPLGTPIRAIADGTVIEAGPASGFGLWVRLRHTDGTVSVYGHMQKITTRVGAKVRAGDQIATVGQRGQSTGPHLHLEIWPQGRRDLRLDPAAWFIRHDSHITTGSAR